MLFSVVDLEWNLIPSGSADKAAHMENNISTRLSELQRALKVPKSQFNNFGGYHYRNLEDILDAVKKLLQSNESVTITDEIILIGDRYYVKAEAVFHHGETYVKATGWAREAATKKGMDESQLTGSTSSYARKYAMNGLFAIDDAKDADTQDNRQQSPPSQPKKELVTGKPNFERYGYSHDDVKALTGYASERVPKQFKNQVNLKQIIHMGGGLETGKSLIDDYVKLLEEN